MASTHPGFHVVYICFPYFLNFFGIYLKVIHQVLLFCCSQSIAALHSLREIFVCVCLHIGFLVPSFCVKIIPYFFFEVPKEKLCMHACMHNVVCYHSHLHLHSSSESSPFTKIVFWWKVKDARIGISDYLRDHWLPGSMSSDSSNSGRRDV